MTTNSSHSRRRILQLTGAVTTGALAGCLDFLPGSDPPVFKSVSVEGAQMVVQLTDDTNADAIDLRGPNDDTLRTVSVGRKPTVSVSLYKHQYTPYPPGKYTLVAIDTSGDEPQTLTKHSLTLTSSVEVTNVRPVTKDLQSKFDTNPPPVVGPVQITLSNTGTLPVGIAYLGFTQGVPSPDLLPKQSIGTYSPISKDGRFLPGGTQRTFSSFGTPLKYAQPPGQSPKQRAAGAPTQGASWAHINQTHCNGEQHTATLRVIPTQGKPLTTAVTFQYSGTTVRHDTLAVDYACTNVTVEQINTKTSTSTPRS